MKIVLLSVGTRGDMQPFIAIGALLKSKGQQVSCAFPEQFRALAESAGLVFASLGSEYIDMLESDLGKAAMGAGGSGIQKLAANIKLASAQTQINKDLLHRQYGIIQGENPDRVLYNGKAVYPILWGLDHPGQNILICPLPYMHTVKGHSHVAFNRDLGPFFNRLTYSLADFGLSVTTRISARWLQLPNKISLKQIRTALAANKAIYTISPALFPKPEDWPENLQVLGYQHLDQAAGWQPDPDLTEFLERHKQERILLVTFGSMTNPDPGGKTSILLEILERNNIPAIVVTASGGLARPEGFDSDRIHFVPEIAYDWVFPKIYAVVHHGGSGTTHLALRFGCASLILPHIIDQFVWDKIVYQLGAGPKGIKIDKISTGNLEPKILELLNDPSFKANAERIARQMAGEDFREEIYQAIIEA